MCCACAALAAHAQIIEAPPMPAQSVGAIAEVPNAAGSALRTSTAPRQDGDFERYQELTEIGSTSRDKAAAAGELERAHAFYCQAARTGSTDALVRLGWMYANGLGVARDDTIASSLFKRAASYGSRVAAQLAMMVRSFDERFPDCLGKGLARAEVEPAQPVARVGIEPAGERASFSASPPSLERQRIATMVVRLAGQFRIDPRLVMAVIGTESNFDPLARSPKNALGLMQLIPETAARFQVSDPLDPTQNLRGGMAYLSWLLSYYRGDVMLAVAAFNAGEGAVDRYRGVPPFPETMAYVQRILAMYPQDRHAFDPRLTPASPIVSGMQKTAGLAPSELN